MMGNTIEIPNTRQTVEIELQVFSRIMAIWHVNENDQKHLLGLTDNEFHQWQANKLAALSEKSINNLARVFDIYKALSILFPNTEQAHAWPNKLNTQFDELSAINFILSDVEHNLSVVHGYLDEQLEGLGDF